jgi:hypothetical protein
VVKGLDRFRDYFAPYGGQYVLIGGTACDLAMEEVGQSFRATQDLDIVLCAEALTDEFIEAFWKFVKDGGNSSRERTDGRKEFYRFRNPTEVGFPKELELFSRKPEALTLPADCTLTPIPAGEEVSSLSAILLDEDYYAWIRQGDRTVDDVHIVGAAYLIPLKMKAWLDLSMRAARGEHIDSRTLRKHPNDVFRLYTILSLDPLSSVPEGIKQDIDEFIQKIEREEIDFKNLGLGNLTLSEVLSDLRVIYDVGNQVSR